MTAFARNYKNGTATGRDFGVTDPGNAYEVRSRCTGLLGERADGPTEHLFGRYTRSLFLGGAGVWNRRCLWEMLTRAEELASVAELEFRALVEPAFGRKAAYDFSRELDPADMRLAIAGHNIAQLAANGPQTSDDRMVWTDADSWAASDYMALYNRERRDWEEVARYAIANGVGIRAAAEEVREHRILRVRTEHPELTGFLSGLDPYIEHELRWYIDELADEVRFECPTPEAVPDYVHGMVESDREAGPDPVRAAVECAIFNARDDSLFEDVSDDTLHDIAGQWIDGAHPELWQRVERDAVAAVLRKMGVAERFAALVG